HNAAPEPVSCAAERRSTKASMAIGTPVNENDPADASAGAGPMASASSAATRGDGSPHFNLIWLGLFKQLQ
ncbi:MAG TPA: hypothetical protein VFJ18_05855, partial [Pararhizobium sp.]|nr:hypothetical protein [Pararhizobium sp.]